MLSTLKARINNEMSFMTSLEEASSKLSTEDEDIKNTFLDDPDAAVIGAENDPSIKRLVDELPDVIDEDNDIDEKDLKNLAENFIPDSIIR